jgi:hypothetical protein
MPHAAQWVLSGVAGYNAPGLALTELRMLTGDPLWSSTSLLVHAMDGTLVDARGKALTPTGVKVDPAQPFDGYPTLSCVTGTAIITPAHPSLSFGTGDFSVEAIVRIDAIPASGDGYALFANATSSALPSTFFISDLGTLQAWNNGIVVPVASSGAPLPLGRFAHVEWRRVAGVLYALLDGVLQWSVPHTANYASTVPATLLANPGGGSGWLRGWLAALRITKGQRYQGAAAWPGRQFARGPVSVLAPTYSATIDPTEGAVSDLSDGGAAGAAWADVSPGGFRIIADFAVPVSVDALQFQSAGNGMEYAQLSCRDGAGRWQATGEVASPYVADQVWSSVLNGALSAARARPRSRAARTLVVVSASLSPFSTRASRLRAIDTQFGGPGRIFGTTKTKASPSNLPTKARVVLLHQRSKLLVRETWSDPDTGDYSFDGLDVRQEFLALAEDAAGNFRAVAAQRLLPGGAP